MLVQEFFGSDLTCADYDALAISAIDEKLLGLETGLIQTKWFEYRHLHPTAATYLYAHHYTAQYRAMYQKIIDQEKGQFVTGSKGKDAMLKSETKGFWKGRQQADKMGIPYDLYIGSAMRFLVEDTIWQRIPRPVHMYSDKVIDHVDTYWSHTLLTGAIEPSIAHLSHENDFTMQCKQDIARWLCKTLQNRRNPHFGLSHFMLDKELIPEEIALEFFSADTIRSAKVFNKE